MLESSLFGRTSYLEDWKEKLLTASSNEDHECVNKLIEEISSRRKEDLDWVFNIPAYDVAGKGHSKTLQSLIEAGMKLEKPVMETLLKAALWNGQVECIKLLVRKGADIESILFEEIQCNQVKTVDVLLKAGVNVDCRKR